MARIFYWSATGNIYGCHSDGNVAVPAGIDHIDVVEASHQIVWPGGSERTARVVNGVLVLRNACPPDVKGLKAWLRANMTQARRNLVRSLYCEFIEDLNAGDWTAFEAGCQYVRANTDTTQLPAAAWTAFKNACATYFIPVTLT